MIPKSINQLFPKRNEYQRLGAERQQPPHTSKPLTHKQEKYAAVMYEKGQKGDRVPSLNALPHVIAFLEHEKWPTGRILKLRTDIHGREYLSRDKHRLQRSSVMGIPLDPGTGQLNAADYFHGLALVAGGKRLSQAGETAVSELVKLTRGIAILDSVELLKQFKALQQAIQEGASSSDEDEFERFDPSRHTIETYTAANDPRSGLAASDSSGENGRDMPWEDSAAQPSDWRKTYGQPDPVGARAPSVLTNFRQDSAETSSDNIQGPRLTQTAEAQPAESQDDGDTADAITSFVSQIPVSPVVLPASVFNDMNAIIDTAARSRGDDSFQVRLDMVDPEASKTPPLHKKKHGFFSKKT